LPPSATSASIEGSINARLNGIPETSASSTITKA
jgi:hypothetical protein